MKGSVFESGVIHGNPDMRIFCDCYHILYTLFLYWTICLKITTKQPECEEKAYLCLFLAPPSDGSKSKEHNPAAVKFNAFRGTRGEKTISDPHNINSECVYDTFIHI